MGLKGDIKHMNEKSSENFSHKIGKLEFKVK